MIKAVIFDLDNTLYDYDSCNDIAERCLMEVVSADLGITDNIAQNLLRNAKANVKRQLGEDVAASHNRLLYMQNICEQAGKNPIKYAMKYYNVYWDIMLEKMEPFDYVLPLLKKLKEKKIKIGILTDLTAHIQYRKLSHLGLSDMIDYITTSEEVGAEKPSKKMFNRMIFKMNVRPDEAIVIGDDQKKDILGAEKVGIIALRYDKHVDIYDSVIKLLGEGD